MTPPRIPEKAVQAQIVRFLRQIGGAVYVLGTVRRRADSHFGTMQTPGLPDLIAFAGRWCVFIEVKAKDGRRSDAQDAFAAHCAAHGCEYVCGGLDEVLAWARDKRIVDVTDYRLHGE